MEEINNILLENKSENCILIGDMNINVHCETEPIVQEYESILAGNGFCMMVWGFTREDFKNNVLVQSCIDHVYIRSPSSKFTGAVIQSKISSLYSNRLYSDE